MSWLPQIIPVWCKLNCNIFLYILCYTNVVFSDTVRIAGALGCCHRMLRVILDRDVYSIVNDNDNSYVQRRRFVNILLHVISVDVMSVIFRTFSDSKLPRYHGFRKLSVVSLQRPRLVRLCYCSLSSQPGRHWTSHCTVFRKEPYSSSGKTRITKNLQACK